MSVPFRAEEITEAYAAFHDRFHAMALRWARIARDHGRADADLLAWLEQWGG